MPLMYRPGGVRKFFNSADDGKKAGYFAAYTEVVAACEAALREGVQPAPIVPQSKPEPPPAAKKPDSDRPRPPGAEPAPQTINAASNIDDMPLDALRELAADHGLDTSLHHKTLRKQVRELIDAQSRTD